MAENVTSDSKVSQRQATQRKLAALDEDDLAVISAHVQDAAVVAADILWRPAENRLVIGMRRPDCDQLLAGECTPRRLISALRFDRVLSCQSRGIDTAAPDLALNLIGLEFYPGNKSPGGQVVLLFASGGILRVDVECLECELADLGPDSSAGTSGMADNLPASTDI